ncbi:MAG: efflux RND transporter periplasmic adaptor subunit [Bacteroidetes bacterium]|nr:efflux RND transporter periplasmic adaptor subunit [Bacteroidota bacterium]MBS1973997.1 efflux RND transporter periplasmic adaptor subunit [Bacteroidota bacterium]
MKFQICLYVSLAAAAMAGCNMNGSTSDASGTFEADEVIVSSEVSGKILKMGLQEGSALAKDSIVAVIDSSQLVLQKQQAQASLGALRQKTMDVKPQIKLLQDQIAVQKAQLANAEYEKERTERLVKAGAATTKQLDDLNNQVDILKKQIAVNEQQIKVQEATTGTQNSTVLSETKPLQKSIAQIEDQVSKTNVINPIRGTVLTKYAMAGEITTPGKALYKIADLSIITLRAYITGAQLSQIKLGQQVKVLVDNGASRYKEYEGEVTWISDKAEFTPKTIQTKEERANLVYAVKIQVKNDGYLKIGMYGEVKFK